MPKVMFALSFISSCLEFWSANYISIYEHSELKAFKNKVLGEIENNRANDLLDTNAYKTLNPVDNHFWQYYNVLIPLQ